MLYLVAAKQASFTRNLEQSFNPEGVFKRKSARFKAYSVTLMNTDKTRLH